ncbi:MAG TPA: LysM peptidoglycan-binding domain-containing protein [Desulfuromonadales bacterium]|nr:LysM peptidoglycan-binding domain-containing protein [Desulfuromonadales bacterium]
MTRSSLITTAGLLLCSLTAPLWGQEYLYAPQPAGSFEKGTVANGILVRDVEIRRGDTLRGISRKFSGHAGYYPQILLFNSISNPNLIYAGTTLKVPVSRTEAAPVEELAKPRERKSRAVKHSTKIQKNHTTASKALSVSTAGEPQVESAASTAAWLLFDKALSAYRNDDCKAALALFDQFLNGNPGSPQAAEASLYKADCYLKLSGK